MDLKCGKLIAKPINSVYTSWNKCVRRILNLPHDIGVLRGRGQGGLAPPPKIG